MHGIRKCHHVSYQCQNGVSPSSRKGMRKPGAREATPCLGLPSTTVNKMLQIASSADWPAFSADYSRKITDLCGKCRSKEFLFYALEFLTVVRLDLVSLFEYGTRGKRHWRSSQWEFETRNLIRSKFVFVRFLCF